jgi:hypothetical protein
MRNPEKSVATNPVNREVKRTLHVGYVPRNCHNSWTNLGYSCSGISSIASRRSNVVSGKEGPSLKMRAIAGAMSEERRLTTHSPMLMQLDNKGRTWTKTGTRVASS